MKLKCPYCHKIIEGEPRSTCPFCSKTMIIPDKILNPDKKRNSKQENYEERLKERIREANSGPDFKLASKPSAVIFAMAILAFAGILLLSRTSAPQTGMSMRELRAEQELRILSIALDRFKKDCLRYPATEEGLSALLINPGVETWNGAYITLMKSDPWRNPYVYKRTDDSYILFSSGPDGIENTDDDIHPPPAEQNEL